MKKVFALAFLFSTLFLFVAAPYNLISGFVTGNAPRFIVGIIAIAWLVYIRRGIWPYFFDLWEG